MAPSPCFAHATPCAAAGPVWRASPPPSVGSSAAPSHLPRRFAAGTPGADLLAPPHGRPSAGPKLRGVGPRRRAAPSEITTADSDTRQEPEQWTPQQIFSVLSGLVGSLFSTVAFSRQREATKNKIAADKEIEERGSSKGVRIVQQLGGSLLDAEAESPLFSLGPVPTPTEASDLRKAGRHFTIITTAALPWLTGTAVNPLLRALYLAKLGKPVVMMLPWLGEEDQKKVFPKGTTFDEPEEQEKAIRAWCKERAKLNSSALPLTFRWYKARFVSNVGSIFPKEDLSKELCEEDPRDVLILEEPEHLCWYHHGERWPTLFSHVIGIVHTNYQDYLVGHAAGKMKVGSIVPLELREAFVFGASNIVCSSNCDVNIKLSDTIMPLPNEVTCNVHGVRSEFVDIGDKQQAKSFAKGAVPVYYLGKALYEKGWAELLELLESAGERGAQFRIDGYGSGPNYDQIVERAQKLKEAEGAELVMHRGLDHADKVIHGYGVLVNPSTSDVLCTVSVEALAMGKRCVLARHPSNRFFEEYFPNRCHFFRIGDTGSFIKALAAAVECGPPQPLPPDQRRVLTWEAASERLFDAAEVRVLSGQSQRPSEAAASRLAYRLHSYSMQDNLLMADLIKEATLGDETPWDEHFNVWRKTYLSEMKLQTNQMWEQTKHLQEHEKYLKERLEELRTKFLTEGPTQQR